MLALILAMSWTLAAQSADDPARLLPAESLVYFGSTSLQASFQASTSTAMARILSEPDVKAFLAEPLRAANHVIWEGLRQKREEAAGLQQMAASLGVGMELNPDDPFDLISIDHSSPPPVGQAFIALTGLRLPDGTTQGLPEVGLVVGAQLLAPGLQETLRNFWAQIPLPDSNSTHAGVEYLAKEAPPGISICMAMLGELVVITTSREALTGIIDRHQRGSSDGGSLATEPAYSEIVAAAGGLRPGGASWFVRSDTLIDLAMMGLQVGLAQDTSISDDDKGRLLGVIESLGLKALRTMGGVSGVDADGRILGTTAIRIDPNVAGLCGRLVRSSGAINLAALESVPRSVLGASASNLGSTLTDLYDFAMQTAESLEPGSSAMATAFLGSAMGEYSLRDDLLANIHGEVLTYSLPGQGMMGANDWVIRMGVRDGDRLIGAIGALLAFVQQQADLPISLQPAEIEGRTIHRLDLSATPAGLFTPVVAIEGGQLVVCSGERLLSSVLSGPVDGEDILDHVGFHAFAERLSSRGDLSSLSYTDVRSSFGTGYQLLSGVAGMFMGMTSLPIDISKLPTEATMSRHLSDSMTGTYRTADGYEVSQSITHFQLSDFLPLVLVAGALWAGSELGISAEAAPAEVDPLELASNDLNQLNASIRIYKIATDEYPNSLDELLQPLPDFPKGAYPQATALPVDPWGNAYRFAVEMHPKRAKLLPKLWSLGPNGIDEAGAGDDVLRF